MQSFEVFSPALKVHQPLVLEASAGTGKTFSIENLVVRALIEPPADGVAVTLEEILLVTFTKKAAAELKARIRKNLQKALKWLTGDLDRPPAYLEAYIGSRTAIQRIKAALVQFDDATISTIHSFCFRALKEFGAECGFMAEMAPEELSQEFLFKVVEGLFRTQLTRERYLPQQLEIVLKRHRYNLTKLCGKLLKAVQRGIVIQPGRAPIEVHHDLQAVLQHLDVASLRLAALQFKEMSIGTSKELKPEVAAALDEYELLSQAADLTEEMIDRSVIQHASVFQKKFSNEKLKLKARFTPEEQRALITLEKELLPLLHEMASYSAIFARLAGQCQKAIWNAFEAKSGCDFSYLLLQMEKMSNVPAFRAHLQKRYRMAIIDEFQDTDPVQWNIFKKIFDTDTGFPLILVGDPKQSIYSFRSADIYTYLQAAQTIGEDARFALATNYRSTPKLVAALNRLFDAKAAPGWINLPHLKSDLPYTPVLSVKKENVFLPDHEPALKFLCVEGKNKDLEDLEHEGFFPYFAAEAKKLHELHQVPFSQIAFLVRDEFQAKRLTAFLRERGLPVIEQKARTAGDSTALPELAQLLKAMLHPRQLSALKAALGGAILRQEIPFLESLHTMQTLGSVVARFYDLKTEWELRGLPAAIGQLLEWRFENNQQTVREKLIAAPQGKELYHELMQLVELLAVQEKREGLYSEAVLEELLAYADCDQQAREDLRLRPLSDRDAIPVMTLHMSKGLEFTAVFALGVVNRKKTKDDLTLLRTEGNCALISMAADDPRYKSFLEESDAEKARQLYVALTRAKERLYIPVINGWKTPEFGSASPLELFLARHSPEAASWEQLYERMQGSFPKIEHPEIEYLTLQTDAPSQNVLQEPRPALIQPVQPSLAFNPFTALSFTGIAQQLAHGYDLEKKPHDYLCIKKDAHTLPAGAATGVLLHELLEALPFEQEFASAIDLVPFVKPYLKYTSFQGWEKTIAEMLYAALNHPLGPDGVRLCRLRKGDYFREMEFTYAAALAEKLMDPKTPASFIKGVVDLFFVYEGKYYLLDWKTNWLGSASQDYNSDALKRSMEQSHYYLQAGLYRQAARRYLELVEKKPFDSCFGGILYVFLRGLDGEYGVLWIP